MISDIIVGETYIRDNNENVKIVAIHPDGKSCACLGLYDNWVVLMKKAEGWPFTETTKLDLKKTYTYLGKVVKNLHVQGRYLKGDVDGHGEVDWWLDGRRFSYTSSEFDLKEATIRDWTLADVPYPWPVVKSNNGTNHYALQLADAEGLQFRVGRRVSYTELRSSYVWSQDGKTWNKFEVVETN